MIEVGLRSKPEIKKAAVPLLRIKEINIMNTQEESKAMQEAVETAGEENWELTPEQLAQAAGGRVLIPATKMHCTACGAKAIWKGDFKGKTFDCPSCGKYAFEGYEILWG